MQIPAHVISFILLLVLQTGSINAQKNEKKPNLLIVLSDQHSYDMLGCNGNKNIKTPNLDKFAQQGARFTHAFTNQPVCTPFRGMLMSGNHPLKNGAFVNDVPLIPNKSKLLGEVLKENGYQTAYIGKWHLMGGNRNRPIPKGEMRYGFDTLLTNNCHLDFRPGKCFFWNDENEKQYFNDWEVYGQTNQVLDYLENIDKSKPFALIVSWHPPHDWGKFTGVDGKKHYMYDTLEELEALYSPDDIKVRPGMEPTEDLKRMYHGYMAMVSGVDKAFGMIMQKLEDIEENDNTLVMFSADHGDMLESHGAVLPKQYPHDYSAHLPLLMRLPSKIKQNTVSDAFIGPMDIMPTALSFLGIDNTQQLDGKDLSKIILNGKSQKVKYMPMWNFENLTEKNTIPWRGILTKKYTFGYGLEDDKLVNVLFDRQKDPDQLSNLFGDPDYAKVQKKLKKQTLNWMEQFNDSFYTKEDFIKIMPVDEWKNQTTRTPAEIIAAFESKR